jgi:two-component system sensor histidine kinase UhpB
LYRIAQEALRNALRHSEASSIRLELQLESRFARLVVVDDGCGFDPQQVTSSKSLGLRGMQERLRILGGQLYLTSTSGRGTRLEAIVPLEASPAA